MKISNIFVYIVFFMLGFNLIIPVFTRNDLLVDASPATWYNASWIYCKEITVTNKRDDYQTRVMVDQDSGGDVDCEGHCNNNFSDLRFADTDANLCTYWIENYVSGDWATVWVNNSGNDSTLYMYYGYSSATPGSNAATTWDIWYDWTSDHTADYTLRSNAANTHKSYVDNLAKSFDFSQGRRVMFKTAVSTANINSYDSYAILGMLSTDNDFGDSVDNFQYQLGVDTDWSPQDYYTFIGSEDSGLTYADSLNYAYTANQYNVFDITGKTNTYMNLTIYLLNSNGTMLLGRQFSDCVADTLSYVGYSGSCASVTAKWTYDAVNDAIEFGADSASRSDIYMKNKWWCIGKYVSSSAPSFAFGAEEFHSPDIPEIIINFAGNLSDSGGPYWTPPGETTALAGVWSDGYYTNGSMQSEDWMYINCSITGASYVHLDWLNGTTWTNGTYHFTQRGSYWDVNTSAVGIKTKAGYWYSFNVNATGEDGTTKTCWNKTGMYGDVGDTEIRRYVQLNCSPTSSIVYQPYYLYKITNIHSDPEDDNKADRLHHDQGTNGTSTDTGYLYDDLPDADVDNVYCSAFAGYWFDENLCIAPFTLDNIYFHVFISSSNDTMNLGWLKTRGYLSTPVTNNNWVSQINSKTNISYNGGTTNDIYWLSTKFLDVTNTLFNENNVSELVIKTINAGNSPAIISNRSFTSFVLFNVPSNVSLNSTGDSDNDGLSDWFELYRSYTNPFLIDTDNDGIRDCNEWLDNTDPNNYTDYLAPAWTNIFNYSSVTGGDIAGWSNIFNYSSITGGDIAGWNILFNYSAVTGGTLSSWNILFNYTSVTGGDVSTWNTVFNYSLITGGDIVAWNTIFNYSGISGGTLSSWNNIFNYSSVTGGDIAEINNIFNISGITGGDIVSWNNLFNYSSVSGGDIAEFNNLFNYSSITGGDIASWSILFNYSDISGGDLAGWNTIFNYTGITGGTLSSWNTIFNYSSVSGGDIVEWNNLFNYSAVTGGDIASWNTIFNYSSVSGGDIVEWNNLFNYTMITGGDMASWNTIFNYTSISGGDSAGWSNIFNYSSIAGGDGASWSIIFNYTGITGGSSADWINVFNYSSVSGGDISSWVNIFNYSSITGGDSVGWDILFNYTGITGGSGAEWNTVFNYSLITGGEIADWVILFNYSGITGGDIAGWNIIFNYTGITGGDGASWSIIFNYTGITGGTVSSWNNIFNYSGISGGDIADWVILFNYSGITGGNIYERTWSILFNYSSVTGGDIADWVILFNYSGITGGDMSEYNIIFNYSSITGGDIADWTNIFNYTGITGGHNLEWNIIFNYTSITGGNDNIWNIIFNYTDITGGNISSWTNLFNYSSVSGGDITYIIISNVHPVNNSNDVDVLPILFFVVNHSLGSFMNLSIYVGVNDTVVVLLNTYLNLTNSTISVIDTNATSNNTLYYWRIVVDDGSGHSLNETYHFYTSANAGVISINLVSRFPLGLGVGIVCMVPFIVLVIIKKRRKAKYEVKRETLTFYRR